MSCNAYFAQLALKTGPQALLDTARILNVALARNNSMQRIRETLPQIGYGQGEVVLAPLKMAQIAASIPSGGRIPQVQPERDQATEAVSGDFLPPSSARLLASYMRDVVVSGTGRSLRDSSVPIRVRRERRRFERRLARVVSGFAPYRRVPRHIAFAVLIEHRERDVPRRRAGPGAKPANHACQVGVRCPPHFPVLPAPQSARSESRSDRPVPLTSPRRACTTRAGAPARRQEIAAAPASVAWSRSGCTCGMRPPDAEIDAATCAIFSGARSHFALAVANLWQGLANPLHVSERGNVRMRACEGAPADRSSTPAARSMRCTTRPAHVHIQRAMRILNP